MITKHPFVTRLAAAPDPTVRLTACFVCRELGGSMRLRIAPGHGHNLWDGFFQCQELV